MRILIADDDREFLDTFREQLEGMELVTALDTSDNGLEAMDRVRESLEHANPYQVIFVDVCMPGEGAFALLEDLRKLEKEKLDEKQMHCKVVFISGYSDEIMKQRARNLSCAGFLDKPIKEEVLKSTLTKLFHHANIWET